VLLKNPSGEGREPERERHEETRSTVKDTGGAGCGKKRIRALALVQVRRRAMVRFTEKGRAGGSAGDPAEGMTLRGREKGLSKKDERKREIREEIKRVPKMGRLPLHQLERRGGGPRENNREEVFTILGQETEKKKREIVGPQYVPKIRGME